MQQTNNKNYSCQAPAESVGNMNSLKAKKEFFTIKNSLFSSFVQGEKRC